MASTQSPTTLQNTIPMAESVASSARTAVPTTTWTRSVPTAAALRNPPADSSQKGEIVDYVPETPPKPTTFAHRTGNSSRFTRPSALHGLGLDGGPSSAPPSPTFCTRCEHNQLIIQSAKNQYDMPPEDHPDYQHHAAVLYPQYVQDFEKRYPPVCSECGPRVRQKLKEANYQAKVASLGHMLVRSERPGVPVKFGPLEGLKWIVWMVRGAVWAWANVLFLVWNLCAALYAPYTSESMVTETPGWTECVLNSIEKSELDPTCYQVSHQQFSKYFPWSLLGFWWLYRQWGMDRHPEKKLVGGREYLNIEVAVVLIRLAAWILLGENGYIQTANKDTLMQFHAGFFFVSFVVGSEINLFLVQC